MITSREYLIAKGLAGPRGRLSYEAQAAIAKAINSGEKFSDYQQVSVRLDEPKVIKTKVVASPKITVDPKRTETVVWGIDKATKSGQSNTLIAFDTCGSCSRSIKYCQHDVPQLPQWLGGGNALMVKPVV